MTLPSDFSSANSANTAPQQTFLGASIRSFNASAGWNGSASTLTVDLVNDEINVSDGTSVGMGDDPYHGGAGDVFSPPPIGSPVYFKFGPERATIRQAYMTSTNPAQPRATPPVPPYTGVGYKHWTFGGILQSYIQNKSVGGNPLFKVTVEDPRELLENAVLILDNYTGTTFNNDNMINVYGFLENEISSDAYDYLQWTYGNPYYLGLNEDITSPDYGTIDGNDTWGGSFPVTGLTKSRKNDAGMYWWKITDALNALGESVIPLPDEIRAKGFGGRLTFRGNAYVVDLSEVPTPSRYYRIGGESITVLALVQELCELANYDFTAALLPPPPTFVSAGYHGIIKIKVMPRTKQAEFGKITSFVNNAAASGIPVTDSNSGFELVNNVTQKFIVGAQTTDMYFFNGSGDADYKGHEYFQQTGGTYGLNSDPDQGTQYGEKFRLEVGSLTSPSGVGQYWKKALADPFDLSVSKRQRIIPFYGFKANGAMTLPLGFGSYSQIELDCSNVSARGLGETYVTTEMELRHVLAGKKDWIKFLSAWNSKWYNCPFNRVVTPRSTVAPYRRSTPLEWWNLVTALPGADLSAVHNASIGHPPYAHPLYFGRATMLGMAVGNVADVLSMFIYNSKNSITNNTPKMRNGLHVSKAGFVAANMSDAKGEQDQNIELVYNWLRGIAEKHLGKTFAVKLTQENVNYGKGNVDGFSIDKGVIRTIYDPMDGKVKGNYEPDVEGGFLPELIMPIIPNKHKRLSDMPDAVKQNLLPIDSDKLRTEEGRFSTYVRFDDAENKNFSKISDENLAVNNVRRSGRGGYVEADLIPLSHLVNQDSWFQSKSAFVKCKLWPQYVFPNVVNPQGISDLHGGPKSAPTGLSARIQGAYMVRKPEIPGELYGAVGVHYTGSLMEPAQWPGGVSAFGTGGFLGSMVNKEDLWPSYELTYNGTSSVVFDGKGYEGPKGVLIIDYDDPYVVIELPGRVYPTKENTRSKKNTQGQILIDYITLPYWKTAVEPTSMRRPRAMPASGASPGSVGPFWELADAVAAAGREGKKALKDKTFIGSLPSVEIPNAATIPLQSRYHTYGPWYTVPSRWNNLLQKWEAAVGSDMTSGKVEFEQDDTLAPWTYGGHVLMNRAGLDKARFGTSDAQVLERGSVTIPDIPSVNIAQQLINGGPYVSEITVSVGPGGVKTTYNMQTYTPKFGKQSRLTQDRLKWLGKRGKEFNRRINTTRKKFQRAIALSQSSTAHKPYAQSEVTGATTSSFEMMIGENRSPLDPSYNRAQTLEGETVAFERSGVLPTACVQPAEDTVQQSFHPDSSGIWMAKAAASFESLVRPFSTNWIDSTQFIASYDRPVGHMGPSYGGRANKTIVEKQILGTNIGYIDDTLERNTRHGMRGYIDDTLQRNALRDGTVEPTVFDLDPLSSGHDISSIVKGNTLTSIDARGPFEIDPLRGKGYANLGSGDLYEFSQFRLNAEGIEVGAYQNVDRLDSKVKLNAPHSNYRGMALRGPLLITGWGYDTHGNIVPSSGEIMGPDARSKKGNPGGPCKDWTVNAHLWKTGPVDLRWDSLRKVWAGGTFLKEGFLLDDLAAATDATISNIESDKIDTMSPDDMDVSSHTTARLLVCEGNKDQFSPSLLPRNEGLLSGHKKEYYKKTIIVTNRDKAFSARYGDFITCAYINGEWRPTGAGGGGDGSSRGGVKYWKFQSTLTNRKHWVGNPELYEVQFHINYYNGLTPTDPANASTRGAGRDGVVTDTTLADRLLDGGSLGVGRIPGNGYWQITGYDWVKGDALLGTNSQDVPATSHGGGVGATFTGWGMPQGYSDPAAKLLKGYATYPAGSPSKTIPTILYDATHPFIKTGLTATGPPSALTEEGAYRLPADLALNSSDSSILALDLSKTTSTAPFVLGSPNTILPRSELATQAYGQGTFWSANFYAYYLDDEGVNQPVFGATASAANNIQSLWTGSADSLSTWPAGFKIREPFKTEAKHGGYTTWGNGLCAINTAKCRFTSGATTLEDVVVGGQIGGKRRGENDNNFEVSDTQLHACVYVAHPEEFTVFDPRGGAIFHYNPSGLGPGGDLKGGAAQDHRDGKLLPYSYSVALSGVLAYSIGQTLPPYDPPAHPYNTIGGYGYANGDVVTVTGGTGTGATAKLVVDNVGTITGVTVVERGEGYDVGDEIFTNPTADRGMQISTVNGSGAVLIANLPLPSPNPFTGVTEYLTIKTDPRPAMVQRWKQIGMRLLPPVRTQIGDRFFWSWPPNKAPVTSNLTLLAAGETLEGTREYDLFLISHGASENSHVGEHYDITLNSL